MLPMGRLLSHLSTRNVGCLLVESKGCECMLALCRERAQRGHELKTPPYLINGLRCSPAEAANMQHDLDSIDRYLLSTEGSLAGLNCDGSCRTVRLSFSFMVWFFYTSGQCETVDLKRDGRI